MITKQNMSINILKKEIYTGSYKGMYYRLEKIEEELKVTIWCGPYSFDNVEEDKKTVSIFPFNHDGHDAAIAWLNEQYIARKDEWCMMRFL